MPRTLHVHTPTPALDLRYQSTRVQQPSSIPVPARKPILDAPLDNPIAVRTMQAFAQEYKKQTQKEPWHVLLYGPEGAVSGVRVKRADVERVFSDPQAFARSHFGPQIKIAYTVGQAPRAPSTHANQMGAAHVRNHDSLNTLERRMRGLVAAPVAESTLAGAHEVLGALLEVSVHPHIRQVIHDLGHGDVPVTMASRETLRDQIEADKKIFLAFDPATFVNYIRSWTRPDAHTTVTGQTLQNQPQRTLAVTAYLNTRSFTGGPINALLNPKDPRLWVQNETREDAQRMNSATLLTTLKLLSGTEINYAESGASALTAYPPRNQSPHLITNTQE